MRKILFFLVMYGVTLVRFPFFLVKDRFDVREAWNDASNWITFG